MSDKDPFEIPQQWDHMPTPKELLKWMTFRPGVEYCWALVKNIAKGKREGWSTVRLHSENDGVIGNVSPIQVIDLDIILLCRGKPILSARKMLWSGLSGADESSVTSALNSAARDPYSAAGYSLVMVHVWSKTLSNVLTVVNGLASDVRVVTPDTLVKLMKTNIANARAFDFNAGAQGWAGATSGKAGHRDGE